MLQWFITFLKFTEFSEILFRLGKTVMKQSGCGECIKQSMECLNQSELQGGMGDIRLERTGDRHYTITSQQVEFFHSLIFLLPCFAPESPVALFLYEMPA